MVHVQIVKLLHPLMHPIFFLFLLFFRCLFVSLSVYLFILPGTKLMAGCNINKRLSQQPALGALIFVRSFVACKANFCSHLASVVHFHCGKIASYFTHSSWCRRSYLSFVLGSQKLFPP